MDRCKRDFQPCLVHVSRNIDHKVRQDDHADILQDFKACYQAENIESVQ
ncbi:transposase [Streptococcus caballi]